MIRNLVFVVGLIAAVAAGYFLRGMPGGKSAASGGPPDDTTLSSYRAEHPDLPVPVVAGAVRRMDVPIYLSGIGTVSAFNTVQIKARLDGELTEIRFHEGQFVNKGDVLAVIDQRPYRAALKQAEAQLARDESALANARRDLDRDVRLKEFASQQKVDTERATATQDEAQISADQAQIDAARTNLDYTTITSPIVGRTGIRGIDVGNIVHANDTTQIVTVTQIEPISVIFTLPADRLGDITRAEAAGPLSVLAYARDNQAQLASGTLTLVDNQIDSTTATVKLKATFANTDHALWPGQFVNARLLLETQRDGLVVPATVVQRGPNGSYAWVIDAEGKVAMRPITVQQVQDGQALVSQGLKSGEQVVIDGQYKLEVGRKVQPIAPPPGPPGPA